MNPRNALEDLGERIDRVADGIPMLDYGVTIGDTRVTVSTALVALGVVVVAFVFSKILQRAIVKTFKLRGMETSGTSAIVRRLLHYAIMAVALGVALDTMGLDISALFAAGAVFAVGIGFAMQNITQNFVSGVILLLERSIKPDDILRVEDRIVRVQKMGIRATLVRSLDDEEIIVPNSTLVQGTVTNYTHSDSMYRLRVVVGVTYDSDMRAVRTTLENTAKAASSRVTEYDPVVLLSEFGSSSVDWEVSIWMNDPWRMRRVKSELLEEIWWTLRDRGIVIAFPQLDVHFDPPIHRALEHVTRVS